MRQLYKQLTAIAATLFITLSAYGYDVKVNNIYYNLNNSNHTASVTKGDLPYSGNIVLPSSVSIDEVLYNVTSIGDYAFKNNYYLTSVSIPNSVTSIGNEAFYRCVGLTSLSIPNTVTSIGDYTFYWCSELSSIEMSNSVVRIGDGAFHLCSCLTSISIPNTVTFIGSSAFEGCSSLTSIEIPNTIGFIGHHTFEGCSGLTSIIIPNSVTTIYDSAFRYCTGLTSVSIPNSVTKICPYAFYGCINLSSISLPNTITDIDYYSLSHCSSLTSVNIPNSVTSIDGYAFSGCSSLNRVSIPNSVTNIAYGAFLDCTSLASISIPNSVTSIGYRAFQNCSNLSRVKVGSGLNSIGSGAFSNCINLKEFICLADEVPGFTKEPNANPIDKFYNTKRSQGTLYVPKNAVAAYSADWHSWGNVIGIDACEGNTLIIDGDNYSNLSNLYCDVLSFTKTFSATTQGKWNAFYVPMSVDVTEHAGELDFAEIYSFCATVDTNGDGTVDADDENFLFVRPIKTGCTKPNLPYLVRPHEAKTYTINSANNILYKAAEEKVEFSTTVDKYTVTGLNTARTVTAGDNNYFVTTNGNLSYRTSGSTTIKANRWIMHRESTEYGGGTGSSSQAKTIRIVTLGEDMDETTAIEMIEKSKPVLNCNFYTLDGRKVDASKSLPSGIYIKNGKKVIIK